MAEKMYGGSGDKDFGHSFFPSPDFLSPSSGLTDPPISGQRRGPSPAPASFLSALNSPFEAMACADDTSPMPMGSLLEPFMKKRGFEENEVSGDRRFKRMMKNRESAARSRDRRLAYTFELEKKKSLLTEENAKLRRVLQGQELFSAAATIEAKAPRKRNLCRSLSALF